MKKALVIGGGFAGCAAAHQLELMGGWDVTVVERAPFLGAGVRTQYYGDHPYTFGPRHFLTPWEHIYRFLNTYVPMRRCPDHQFLTYVEQDARFYNYPIHADDIREMPEARQIENELSAVNTTALQHLTAEQIGAMTRRDVRGLNNAALAKNFEEFWIYSIGQTLYDKFVDKYSRKMWMLDDNKLIDDFTWSPKGVTVKEGERAAWDTAISAYPIAYNGYDDYFRIATKNAHVHLATTIEHYDIPSRTVLIDGTKRQYDIIVNTISPDLLFEQCYGELPYIGRDLYTIVLPIEFALPKEVYFVYYAGNERFTRVTEYKKFTLHRAPTTLISIEIPTKTSKYYPMPLESEKAKAKQYFDLMPDEVFSIGRAGSYLYNVDIDDTIRQAMEVRDRLES